jgi:hypothetical protein
MAIAASVCDWQKARRRPGSPLSHRPAREEVERVCGTAFVRAYFKE